eukprot:m.55631 g.55631  ORF g.55631 m.55631 type:complete len:74 (+) comp34499_c0_seq1:354-575(+)
MLVTKWTVPLEKRLPITLASVLSNSVIETTVLWPLTTLEGVRKSAFPVKIDFHLSKMILSGQKIQGKGILLCV